MHKPTPLTVAQNRIRRLSAPVYTTSTPRKG